MNISSTSGSFPNPLLQQSSLQKIEGQNCTLTAYNSPRLNTDQMQAIANDLFKELANSKDTVIELNSDHPKYQEILQKIQVEASQDQKIVFALKKLNVISDGPQIIIKGKPSRATIKVKSAEVTTQEIKAKFQEIHDDSSEVANKKTIPPPPTPPRPDFAPELPIRRKHVHGEEIVKKHPEQFPAEERVTPSPTAPPLPQNPPKTPFKFTPLSPRASKPGASGVTPLPISQPTTPNAPASPKFRTISKLTPKDTLKHSPMPLGLWNKKNTSNLINESVSAPQSPRSKMPLHLPSSNSAPVSPKPPPIPRQELVSPTDAPPPPFPKNSSKPSNRDKISPPPIPPQFIKEKGIKSSLSGESLSPFSAPEGKRKTPPPLPPGYGNQNK